MNAHDQDSKLTPNVKPRPSKTLTRPLPSLVLTFFGPMLEKHPPL